jgi:AcrR family transcriptional regulator
LKWRKAAFTGQGANASLEEIAKQAGVGIGTLYRHFPTRDALIEGVYRNEVEKLATAASRFTETMSPLEALRAWMLLAGRLHRGKAHHCARAQYHCRRSVPAT